MNKVKVVYGVVSRVEIPTTKFNCIIIPTEATLEPTDTYLLTKNDTWNREYKNKIKMLRKRGAFGIDKWNFVANHRGPVKFYFGLFISDNACI